MSEIELRLNELGIVLPDAPKAMGNFAPFLVDGNQLYISGQVSIDSDGGIIQGQLSSGDDIEKGQYAAKCCAIGLLARAKAALGNLDHIQRLLKLGAFVNAAPGFSAHPSVVNGASDLMVAVLGKEKGHHVRFAVGTSSLPSNASVEIEALFKIA